MTKLKKFYFLKDNADTPLLILADTEEQAAIEVARQFLGMDCSGQLFSEEDWFDYREREKHAF